MQHFVGVCKQNKSRCRQCCNRPTARAQQWFASLEELGFVFQLASAQDKHSSGNFHGLSRTKMGMDFKSLKLVSKEELKEFSCPAFLIHTGSGQSFFHCKTENQQHPGFGLNPGLCPLSAVPAHGSELTVTPSSRAGRDHPVQPPQKQGTKCAGAAEECDRHGPGHSAQPCHGSSHTTDTASLLTLQTEQNHRIRKSQKALGWKGP